MTKTQLPSLKASNSGAPRWPRDGAAIAFDARLEGHGDIFVISAGGGSPRRLTSDPADDNVPMWSRDGKWIYFSSNRTGNWQIWKVPSVGGTAVQVTANGGVSAQESPDGTFLYVWGAGGAGWRTPVAGGGAVRGLQGGAGVGWGAIAPDRLYFVDGATT